LWFAGFFVSGVAEKKVFTFWIFSVNILLQLKDGGFIKLSRQQFCGEFQHIMAVRRYVSRRTG